MYCQRCGAENDNSATICSTCSHVLTVAGAMSAAGVKTSGLAVTSLVLGILAPFTCLLTAIPAVICGIVGLVKISKGRGQLKGTGMAITGIVLPVVLVPVMSMIMAIMMPALSKARHSASKVVCGTRLKGLAAAIFVYADEYDDRLPTADNWCDLLITEADVGPKSFVCPDSDAIEGESSYALNENIAGMKLSDIPGDTVILFETNYGKTDSIRDELLKNRLFFSLFEESGSSDGQLKPDELVFSQRFNQTGGAEILTTENHDGYGCNILFADGAVNFVRSEHIPALRWTVE